MESLSESEEESFIHTEQQEKNTSSSSYLRRNVEPFTIDLDSEVNSEADDSIMEGWESDNTVTGNNATVIQECLIVFEILKEFLKVLSLKQERSVTPELTESSSNSRSLRTFAKVRFKSFIIKK